MESIKKFNRLDHILKTYQITKRVNEGIKAINISHKNKVTDYSYYDFIRNSFNEFNVKFKDITSLPGTFLDISFPDQRLMIDIELKKDPMELLAREKILTGANWRKIQILNWKKDKDNFRLVSELKLKLDNVLSVLSKQLTLDDIYLDNARKYSQLSTCTRRSVGVVLVKDGKIISTGTNGSPAGAAHCTDVRCFIEKGHCLRTIHAEINALLFQSKQELNGSSLYSTDFPCSNCLKTIIAAGVTNVFYERDYVDDTNKKLAELFENRLCLYQYINDHFERITDFNKGGK